MKRSTIQQLNSLNRQFYQTIGTSFSASRQHFWPGWQHVWQAVHLLFEQTRPAHVLDLGCGNGRFAKFLDTKTNHFRYLGVDQDQQLLEIAGRELVGVAAPIQLQQLDLIEKLLTQAALVQAEVRFELIVVLGVLHHLPSYQLRKKLLEQLPRYLSKGGVLVLSCWQFQQNHNLFDRRVEPESVGVDVAELEPNDYLLTWERESPAVRYCHLIDREEQDQLVAESKLSLLARFSADGLSNSANQYLVLQQN